MWAFQGSWTTHGALWIAMEYCGGGSVADLVHAADGPLDQDIIAYLCAETLAGLTYLHSIGKVPPADACRLTLGLAERQWTHCLQAAVSRMSAANSQRKHEEASSRHGMPNAGQFVASQSLTLPFQSSWGAFICRLVMCRCTATSSAGTSC